MSNSTRVRSLLAPLAVLLLVAPAITGWRHLDASGPVPPSAIPVTSVGTVGMTVSDLRRSLDFYTRVLPFQQVSEVEQSGREFELQVGVFGARARTVTLRLGQETLALTEFLAPRGRPIPDDFKPNDAAFQHVAIIVSDMDRAYARLREGGVTYGSTGPQRLPDWNPNAGGIKAFYFRDPDRHFLELLQFPDDKGAPQWQRKDALFLGIDHTAIVSMDTERSLAMYRDVLRMTVAGSSENFDIEQERLNNVFGARLRITALRAASGPGIELLEYLAPGTGRPAPTDLAANDIAHWQTTLRTSANVDLVPAFARHHLLTLVSPMATLVANDPAKAILVRDPDGHALRLIGE